MKKIIYSIICILIIGMIFLLFMLDLNKGDNKKNNLEKIRVAEVAHTVFYAPQYAAISQGFFEEEGLDVELILTPGAVKLLLLFYQVMLKLVFLEVKLVFMYTMLVKKII